MQDGLGKEEASSEDASSSKRRRCRTWGDVHGEDVTTTTTTTTTEVVADCTDDVTLELFPLRPQGKAN